MKSDFSAVMFHHFHGGPHPKGQGSISGQEFDQILISLKKSFNLLDAGIWMDKFLSGKLAEKDICISFDDNLKCQFDIAKSVLDKHGINAFWFVYTSPYAGVVENIELYRYFRTKFFSDFDNFFLSFCNHIDAIGASAVKIREAIATFSSNDYFKEYLFYTYEDRLYRYIRDIILSKDEFERIMDSMISSKRIVLEEIVPLLWMSQSEIKQLSDEGHIIGLHSHSHPFKMENLPIEQQAQEFQTNKTLLESIIGKEIKTVSHPCGSYSSNTLHLLKSMDMVLGFKDSTGYINESNSSLNQPRLDHCFLLNRYENK
jgi:hypothetical protein